MDTKLSVMSPLGEYVGKEEALVSRLPDLNGKTVGEVWNGMFRGDVLFPALRELIQKRYQDVKFVTYKEMPAFEVWGNIDQLCQKLKEAIREKGCDVLIAGVGG